VALRVAKAKLAWADVEALSEQELDARLYGERKHGEREKPSASGLRRPGISNAMAVERS
jgi:hypothetical protein